MKLLITALAISLLASCATIISGTYQDLSFDSSPQGAEVYLDNVLVGNTPFVFEAEKNVYTMFRIEKDGYRTVQRETKRSFDVVTLLGLPFYAFPITADAITGAVYEYNPGSYFIELQPD
ncbi:MAG: hypothetical protein ACI9RY_000627 [Reinekea sp.]|jgi:hypothetical protein